MALRRQIWTLIIKNLRWLLLRHAILCALMALVIPIALAAFFTFAKDFFIPPAKYGISPVRPVMRLSDAFAVAEDSGRNKVVLINNGNRGGSIDRVLDGIASAVGESGSMQVLKADNEDNLTTICRSNLRGVTSCFGAVVMRSSPNEGPDGVWNYTIRTDAAFWSEPIKFKVDSSVNVQQVYLLPIQRAVDRLIAGVNGSDSVPLADSQELAFTSLTQSARTIKVRQAYSNAIINYMGVAFIANLLWITYHLTGFMAAERESGMSQLIDAMMPVSRPWMAPVARIVAHHLSFSTVYAPAWIVGSIIIWNGVFSDTNAAVVLFFNLLAGLALTSLSILFASCFRRAQLSGITAILSILLLGILAQALTQPNTGPVVVLSLLFTPCTFVYFMTFMARFEKQGKPSNLLVRAPDSPWNVPGIVFFVILLIHIFIYPLLAVLVETKRWGSCPNGRAVQTSRHCVDGGRDVLPDDAVQLNNMTKIYDPSFFSRVFSFLSKPRESVIAVKDLTLRIRRGQIVALLGANGSGKSTTLDAVAGLHRVTSGSIAVDARGDGMGGLGIAPQKNVLWDDLTVEEHLTIFNRLKAPEKPATSEEIVALIGAIDLLPKRNALAKTLSGGQKRKLQLGIMLTGGSAVCCVDEVSSGLDPLSRRKIWDILLAERGKRTLILTTHFLDEADLLADHIAILSKGTLRAEGSSVELKNRFGGGYRVHVSGKTERARLATLEGVGMQESAGSTTYLASTSGLAARVIKNLDAQGVSDYRFSGPTIEDVFLQLAEEAKDEGASGAANTGAQVRADETTEHVKDEGASESAITRVTVRADKTTEARVPSSRQDSSSSRQGSAYQDMELLDGQRVGYIDQAVILFRKRMTVLRRDWKMYLVAFVLPILAAGLTSLYVRGRPRTGCSAADQASSFSTEDAFTQVKDDKRIVFLAGPPNKVTAADMSRLLRPVFNGSRKGGAIGATALSNLQLVDSFDAWQQFIKENYLNVTTAIWLGDDSSRPALGWAANLFITSAITAQQFLDVLVTNMTIATTWASFDVPFNPEISDALQLVVYMCLALSCYPAFFSLYPSNERRRFVRALQYSNGVRPFPLWAAYTLFDFAFVLVASAIVTGLWAGLSDVWFHLEYIFVVFFLYGLASIVLSYVISLFTKTQLGTFAWTAAYQAVCFLSYLIAYVCIVTYAPVAKIDASILVAHFALSALAPICSAMRAMFLATNLFSIACDGEALSTRPGTLEAYGGPILYLVLQCIGFFGLLLWLDSGSVGSSLRRILERKNKTGAHQEVDEAVADELRRMTSVGEVEDGLRVMHVTKSFGKNTAVDNVSFGIRRGEVFALLGPNGAGKSTTISLIRGDVKPSLNGGDIYVEDKSVVTNLAAARTHLGVCPQIDAMDQMTVREHLEFYARIRGISDVQHNVSAVLQAVGLGAFASRMASALSGGNKRKLSLGIALMGNPTVLLLDEPSSGLDAAAKRIMWNTLAATVSGRSILLTTHSMEEADALAGRAGILARRMLALGSPDDLRQRFGDAIHVHLVCNTAPRTPDEEMARVMAWIRDRLPSATAGSRMYHGQIRFSVPVADVPLPKGDSYDGSGTQRGSAIGRLIVLLEEHKDELKMSHYSVSPTTLDQVFLTIVGQHQVREENYDEKPKGWWADWIPGRHA